MHGLWTFVFHLFYLYIAFQSSISSKTCSLSSQDNSLIAGMSDSSQDASTSLIPLAGRHNYNGWAQEFQIAAQYQGFWRLYTGEEQIKEAPLATYYQSEVEKAKTAFMASYWQHRYESDVWERKEQQKKIQAALAFLAEAVQPAVRNGIQEYDLPEDAWDALRDAYYEPEPTELEMALQKMHVLHLSNCLCMADFLNHFHIVRAEIKSAGGVYTDSQCIVKLLNSITPDYVPFLNHNITMQKLAEMEVNQFTSYLFAFEPEIMRRAEYALPIRQ